MKCIYIKNYLFTSRHIEAIIIKDIEQNSNIIILKSEKKTEKELNFN